MLIERTSRAVLTVRFLDVKQGWEYWVLLRSDAHHDSKACNRKAEKRHLDEVINRDGMWADFGDLFDAMQGKYDPRRDYDELRSEYKGKDYYDRLVSHAVDFYEPYAERCLLLAMGGHETSAERNVGTNLTSNLAHRLNVEMLAESDHKIATGGFGGWIRFMFTMNKTRQMQLRLRYMHGAGGRAPVTKGVIQTARQAVYLPDANMVINGHNHQAYIVPLRRERISSRGVQFKDTQWHGRIPGYKDDYGDGTGGWAIEKGFEPSPIGALWLHFKYGQNVVEYSLSTEFE